MHSDSNGLQPLFPSNICNSSICIPRQDGRVRRRVLLPFTLARMHVWMPWWTRVEPGSRSGPDGLKGKWRRLTGVRGVAIVFSDQHDRNGGLERKP